MTSTETLQEVSKNEFMQPEMYKGADLDTEILEGLDWEDGGIYCRLSASGFLDCTDWSGPFNSVESASEYLLETYYN